VWVRDTLTSCACFGVPRTSAWSLRWRAHVVDSSEAYLRLPFGAYGGQRQASLEGNRCCLYLILLARYSTGSETGSRSLRSSGRNQSLLLLNVLVTSWLILAVTLLPMDSGYCE